MTLTAEWLDELSYMLRRFLKRNRLGIGGPDIFEEATRIFERGNSGAMNRFTSRYPEFISYFSCLKSGEPPITFSDIAKLSDGELVRRQDRRGDIHCFAPIPEVETPIMQWIVENTTAAGLRTLDIGCGVGSRLTFLIKQQILKDGSVGIDLSDKCLGLARQISQSEGVGTRFLKASADQIPFPDASFETIWLFDVLLWVKRYEQAVSEISRLLVPSGRLLLMYNNKEHWRNNIKPSVAIDLLRRYGIVASFKDHYDGHERRLFGTFIVGDKT